MTTIHHLPAYPRPEATHGGTTSVRYDGTELKLWYVVGERQVLTVSTADYASGMFTYPTGSFRELQDLLEWAQRSPELANDIPRMLEVQRQRHEQQARERAEKQAQADAKAAKDARVKLPSALQLSNGKETYGYATELYRVGIYVVTTHNGHLVAQSTAPSRAAAARRLTKIKQRLLADGFQLDFEYFHSPHA